MKHKMNVADGVTASRIVFAAFILLCSPFSVQFYALYVLGALTDIIDGQLARKLNLKSPFGAKIDTISDFVFVIAVLVKLLPSLDIPEWLWIWIAVIAFIKLANMVLSFVMFHGMVPMHTVMNKITGFMLFLLPFGIGRCSRLASAIAVIVICSTATFAAIQEGYFICVGKKIQ